MLYMCQWYCHKTVKFEKNIYIWLLRKHLLPFHHLCNIILPLERKNRGLCRRLCLCPVFLLCWGSGINFLLFCRRIKNVKPFDFRVGSLYSNPDFTSHELCDLGRVIMAPTLSVLVCKMDARSTCQMWICWRQSYALGSQHVAGAHEAVQQV